MSPIPKKIHFVKMLVLEMLSIDDEPLNLILSEAVVSQNNKNHILPFYHAEVITQSDIKEAIKDLEQGNLILLLDEQGIPLGNKNIDQVLESNREWEFWFRISKKGMEIYESSYSSYFV